MISQMPLTMIILETSFNCRAPFRLIAAGPALCKNNPVIPVPCSFTVSFMYSANFNLKVRIKSAPCFLEHNHSPEKMYSYPRVCLPSTSNQSPLVPHPCRSGDNVLEHRIVQHRNRLFNPTLPVPTLLVPFKHRYQMT